MTTDTDFPTFVELNTRYPDVLSYQTTDVDKAIDWASRRDNTILVYKRPVKDIYYVPVKPAPELQTQLEYACECEVAGKWVLTCPTHGECHCEPWHAEVCAVCKYANRDSEVWDG